ncbi:MAG: RsmD family RNA methyltransferase [Bacteroidota bacterium]
MQIYNINIEDLSLFDLKSFLNENLGVDISKTVLKLSQNKRSINNLLFTQLEIYPKAVSKLPTFTSNDCYFTSKSFEQSSSEATALFKASLFKGNNMLDLSGGLGVDDWAFSKKFKHVVSIDKDEELNKIVRFNFDKLNVKNVDRIDADANEFIKQNNHYDLIYLDADRRPESTEKRVLSLKEGEPNIIVIQERLFEITDTILLKLSPMLDITAIINELKNVSDVYVIAYKNEVKELLVTLKKQSDSNIQIHAVDIEGNKNIQYTDTWKNENQVVYHSNGSYFFEPALSIIKAGLSASYASKLNLKMLDRNSYYFTGDKFLKDFMGRQFEVITLIVFSKSAVKNYLKLNSIEKANVSKRNFPMEVKEIRNEFQLKDGGDDYLFFTQNSKKQKLLFHCRK